MASNDDIIRALGKLEGAIAGMGESIKQLREDFSDEKERAHESRATIHQRLDEQQRQISRLDTTVAISGEIDGQLRDQIAELGEKIEKNQKAVEPALHEWNRIKILGAGVGGLLLMLGISAGAVIAWASDTAVSIIRHWLRIN
jgi:hypothetical protein